MSSSLNEDEAPMIRVSDSDLGSSETSLYSFILIASIGYQVDRIQTKVW